MRRSNRVQSDLPAFQAGLNELHGATGSWREVGLALGKSASYAMRVARGDLAPSLEAVASWEEYRTGKVLRTMEVPACPDCGDVHTGRCHGKQVIQVVVLAPGERVTAAPEPAPKQAGKPRKREDYFRPCMVRGSEEHMAYLAWKGKWDQEHGA